MRVGPWSYRTADLIRRGKTPEFSLCTQRKGHVSTEQEGTIYKLGREASPEANTTYTLILDSQPPELWGDTFLLFKLPSLWYFVITAQADYCNTVSQPVTKSCQLFFFLNKFIYLFLVVLGLRCCAFSSCGELGLLFIAVRGLLLVVASHIVKHRI